MDNSSSVLRCPGCQRVLEPGRAQGLCPRCLLVRAAFATEAEMPAASAVVPPIEAVAVAFPQLEIVELIGRGGMGVVYRARQKALNRMIALKLLAPGRERDPGFAERFAREARALAVLNHPNIVTVHDFGFAAVPAGPAGEGFYYLLMEFVDGVNLRQAMRARRFTPEQALAIVPPVCAALQFAHDRGVVHRDIKPENLLLDKDGHIKIADFGIAKMLASSPGQNVPTTADDMGPEDGGSPKTGVSSATHETAVGTPGYMAPEQRTAPAQVDHRADIYSLGVVIYELLTGELPGPQLLPPSQRVQIDVRLDEIVLRALSVRPELRFATADDFKSQIDTVIHTSGNSDAERRGTNPSLRPRLLKHGTGMLLTAERLTTWEGQFFAVRTRGTLRLDELELTHTARGVDTSIPLTAIRDVSIGQLPRSMNPAGIHVLSVTYEDSVSLKRVLIFPMEGLFAFPSTQNSRVAEWAELLRDAVIRATGRPPGVTPAQQLGMPSSHLGIQLLLYGMMGAPALIAFAVIGSIGGAPSAGLVGLAVPILAVPLMVGGSFLALRWMGRPGRMAASSGSPPRRNRRAWGIGLVVSAVLWLLGCGAYAAFSPRIYHATLLFKADSTVAWLNLTEFWRRSFGTEGALTLEPIPSTRLFRLRGGDTTAVGAVQRVKRAFDLLRGDEIGGRLIVVDAPTLPLWPSQPNVGLALFSGLAGALALGVPGLFLMRRIPRTRADS